MKASFCNCGKFTSRGEWIHPKSKNQTDELIFVIEGKFSIEEETDDGKFDVYNLEVGDILFLEADRLHRGIGIAADRVSFYWIHFYRSPGEKLTAKHIHLRDLYSVSLLCRQIMHYADINIDPGVLDRLLYVLIEELSLQSQKREPEGSLASRVSEWIRINSDRQLTASDISNRFGYNEEYISRLLKQQYGHGLKQLMTERRLEHLKYLLSESELTLTEIALSAGFQDTKLFLKFFKYHEGISPTAYRSIYKLGHTNNR